MSYPTPGPFPMPWYPPPPREPKPLPCNHILHLLLSVFTAGLWLPVWLLLGLTTESANRKIREEHRQKMAEYNRWMFQTYGPR